MRLEPINIAKPGELLVLGSKFRSTKARYNMHPALAEYRECSAKSASHWPYVQDTPSCPCDVWLSVINQLSSSSSILLRFASNDG